MQYTKIKLPAKIFFFSVRREGKPGNNTTIVEVEKLAIYNVVPAFVRVPDNITGGTVTHV